MQRSGLNEQVIAAFSGRGRDCASDLSSDYSSFLSRSPVTMSYGRARALPVE